MKLPELFSVLKREKKKTQTTKENILRWMVQYKLHPNCTGTKHSHKLY